MVSNEFIQSLLLRYSTYLFGGKCTIVVNDGAMVISCKQNDDGILNILRIMSLNMMVKILLI